MAKKSYSKPAKVLSVAFSSDDDALLKQIGDVVKAALAKLPDGVTVPMTVTPDGGWSQSGGWVREQDGWPQDGGWYLSKDRTHLEQIYPPLKESLRNVLGSFANALKAASKEST